MRNERMEYMVSTETNSDKAKRDTCIGANKVRLTVYSGIWEGEHLVERTESEGRAAELLLVHLNDVVLLHLESPKVHQLRIQVLS